MISLKLVKQHLNLDENFKDDDYYLMTLAEVAEQAVTNHINSSTGDELYDDDGNYLATILLSMLLLIGNLYSHRDATESGGSSPVPYAYDYLLQLNKSYVF